MAEVTGSAPAYLSLLASGELERRAEAAREILRNCVLCARHCRVDRLVSVAGAACRTGELALVSAVHPHHGEESVLSGSRGSGTIFFGSCNLRCQYCKNWGDDDRLARPGRNGVLADEDENAIQRDGVLEKEHPVRLVANGMLRIRW